MKPLLASLLLVLLASPAAAGPDFVTPSPRPNALAASAGTRDFTPEDDVTFAHDSAALTPGAIMQVDSAARWLRSHPRQRIVVEGYADHTGLASYNEDLATRRAQSVRTRLLDRGISSDRIVIAVFGESFADPAGNPLDRRAVMYASDLPTRALVTASLERKLALSAMWTERGALYTEGQWSPPVHVIATR